MPVSAYFGQLHHKLATITFWFSVPRFSVLPAIFSIMWPHLTKLRHNLATTDEEWRRISVSAYKKMSYPSLSSD